jgi:hypothetical protein
LPGDRPPTACRRDGFRFSFTPLAGVLFAFPSRYSFTIGRQGIFSLGGWSPLLPTGLLGPRGTRAHGSGSRRTFVYRALTVSGGRFHGPSTGSAIVHSPGYTPSVAHNPRRVPPPGLGSSPFARRYLGNLGWFLLLEVLRCFSSPGSPPAPMDSARDTWA